MTSGSALLLVALLAQAEPLPPNHPPIGDAREAPPSSPLPPGHPDTSGRPAPTAADLIAQLEKRADLAGKDKPFDIAFAIAKLYYSQGRYGDAARYFGDALGKLKPLEALVPKATSAMPSGCLPSQHPMESRVSDARKKGPGCAQALLVELADVRLLHANALYLSGDAKAAKAVLERVLALQSNHGRALFQRAMISIEAAPDDVAVLKRAVADLRLAASDPALAGATDAQLQRTEAAVLAGGFSKLRPETVGASASATGPKQLPPALTRETIEAFEKIERTPELDANLARLVEQGEGELARGNFQGALDAFRQVMPLQPGNPRLRAGMAWALVSLNRQPMADRVWSVALEDPSAVDRLGDALLAKGDAAGARRVWEKLARDRADYAPRLEQKLR